MPNGAGEPGVRLSELVATNSLATDLGLGQPFEHVARSTLVALELAKRVGLGCSELEDVYFVGLLAFVGCTVDGDELGEWFGDDIAFRAATYDVDLAGLPLAGFLLRRVGGGRSRRDRARLAAALLVTRGRVVEQAMATHCQVTGQLAERLSLGSSVSAPLQHVFARWDGKGVPAQLAGEKIALSARLVQLAEVTEVFHHVAGIEAAVEVARSRSGTQFDPALVETLAEDADAIFGNGSDANWDRLVAAEPEPGAPLLGAPLDRALGALADFADLRSPPFAGHSRATAKLAEQGARHAGLPEDQAIAVRRAALLQDLGRAGVPSTVWAKSGPLTDLEWEKVRMHPYFTERMLSRCRPLAAIGAIAAMHHERMDGSGYHRGLAGGALPAPARILAAADAYHAMTQPRPHRLALAPEDAARRLRYEASRGSHDAVAVDAVLAAARGAGPRRRAGGPAGLTPREVEVLGMVARGARNKEIARALVITEKTVGNHVEHIYSKIGVSTRAGAALFAMEHGLIAPDVPT